jgi:hypothetical protein
MKPFDFAQDSLRGILMAYSVWLMARSFHSLDGREEKLSTIE